MEHVQQVYEKLSLLLAALTLAAAPLSRTKNSRERPTRPNASHSSFVIIDFLYAPVKRGGEPSTSQEFAVDSLQ